MKCEEIRERFLESVHDAPNDAVKAHLATCAECMRAWSELASTLALLEEWKVPEPSAFFDTRMRARLAEVKAEEAARQQGWFSWLRQPMWGIPMWRPLSAGVLAVVIMFGVSLMDRPQRPDTVDVAKSTPGTAVADLQALENNQDAISQLELLDDLDAEEAASSQEDLL